MLFSSGGFLKRKKNATGLGVAVCFPRDFELFTTSTLILLRLQVNLGWLFNFGEITRDVENGIKYSQSPSFSLGTNPSTH